MSLYSQQAVHAMMESSKATTLRVAKDQIPVVHAGGRRVTTGRGQWQDF